MSVDLLEGEKVLYTKEYTKNRSRTKCSVTVTDRRVINTVESKKFAEKTEIKIEEVNGVKTKFRPASMVQFIVCVILAVVYVLYGFIPVLDGMPYFVFIIYKVFRYIILVGMFVCAIIGIFKIRNGLNVIISTKNKEINFISASSITGKIKPLKIQPDKNSAKELAYNLSAAIKNAKAA